MFSDAISNHQFSWEACSMLCMLEYYLDFKVGLTPQSQSHSYSTDT